MKFLISELSKYVNIKNKNNKELNEIFTSLAFEVEEIIPSTNIQGAKLTKIKRCQEHPNADTLKFCETNINGELIDVVCGGKNVDTGQVVLHAVPGSKVGDVTLERKSLRGIVSNGMILSISEILGISNDLVEDVNKGNIHVFDESVLNSGKTPEQLLELEGDIFDLSILPDRQYASSYFTMARDIASYLNIDYDWSIEEFKKRLKTNMKLELGENATSIFATDVALTKSETPFFIKKVLYHSGIKVKNTIEDVMAYATLITGASTYVIDRNKEITLDGRKLNKKIDIFNSDSVLTEKTEVTFVTISTDETSIIAHEKELNKVFGIKNLRGTTPLNAKLTSEFVLSIAAKAGYLKSASNIVSETKEETKEFILEDNYIFDYIGKKFDLKKILKKLEKIDIKKEGKDKYITPDYRKDIDFKEDIIEEIVRLFGIDKIKSDPLKVKKEKILPEIHKEALIKTVDELTKYGFVETKSYQLVTEENAKKYNIWNQQKFVQLKSEYTLEYNTLQTSLLSGLIDSYRHNHRNDHKNIKLFELSNIFHNEEPKYTLGIIHDEHLNENEPILATKELVLRTIELFGIEVKDITFETKKFDIFNEYVSSEIKYKGKQVGIIGEIHPSILRENKFIRLDKVKAKLYYSELILEELLQ